MSARAAVPRLLRFPSLRQTVARHPIAAYLLLLYAVAYGLALVPVLTVPKPLPNEGHLYGVLSSVVGCAGSAFAVSALAGGRDAVRDLARRCLRWRVPLRWYAVALLGLPALTLVIATALYGSAPLRALGQNWLTLFSSYLPTLAPMVDLTFGKEARGPSSFRSGRCLSGGALVSAVGDESDRCLCLGIGRRSVASFVAPGTSGFWGVSAVKQ